MRSIGSTATGVLAVVVGAAVLLTLASGAAFAGDNVALFSFEPDEVEADPGEEVTVDIVMASHGGYGGEGVANVSFAVDYDAETLSVTDLEAGPWLEDDGVEVEVEEEIDESAGEAWLNQSREGEEGTTGTEPIATATLEVEEDAEPTNATLSITGSSATLVTGDPQSTMVRDAVVVVGGGEPEGDDTDDGDDPDGVTLADDAEPADGGDGDRTGDTEGGSDGAEEADDEGSTTTAVIAGAVAFVAVVGLAAIALRKRDPGV